MGEEGSLRGEQGRGRRGKKMICTWLFPFSVFSLSSPFPASSCVTLLHNQPPSLPRTSIPPSPSPPSTDRPTKLSKASKASKPARDSSSGGGRGRGREGEGV